MGGNVTAVARLDVEWDGTESFTVKSPGYPDRTYKVTDYIPTGYFVWNIGTSYMPDGWVPLCRWADPAKYVWPGEAKIDTNRLLAIKTTPRRQRILMDAAACGAGDTDSAKEFLAVHRNARPGTAVHDDVKNAKEALKYLDAMKKRPQGKGIKNGKTQ